MFQSEEGEGQHSYRTFTPHLKHINQFEFVYGWHALFVFEV